MQERTWLKPLPKIDKELELIKICVDTLQTCAVLPQSPATKNIQLSAENILMRYLQQLDILTRPNETSLKTTL
jgi:hypothetical protein